MNQDFQKKIALVTGSERPDGIGYATVDLLMLWGATVVMHCRPRGESERIADAACAALEEKHKRRPLLVTGDLEKTDDIESMFKRIAKDVGELHILVNNAAMASWVSVEGLSEDVLNRAFKINVAAPLLCIKHAVPLMKEGGRIVNISTFVTETPLPSAVDYLTVKKMLEAITIGAAADLRYSDPPILVNAIQPGLVETRSLALLGRFKRDLFEPLVKWLKEHYREDVVMKAEDIAPFVLRLCSFQRQETGQIVLVDNGVTAFVQEHYEEFQDLLRRI